MSATTIANININLFGRIKRRIVLQVSGEKDYNIDEIYGLFSDDYTFQFVREASLPFEKWEEVEDKSPFTYYELVHKRQFQLFHMESGAFLTEPFADDIPWHNGETMNMNGHTMIPIDARSFIPKSLIRHNRITETDLGRFSNFISKLLATNPSLLEEYFPKEPQSQKVI